jgi:high-affinity iron transporter
MTCGLLIAASLLVACTGGGDAPGKAPGMVAGPASCRWNGPGPQPGSQEFTVRNHDYGPVRIVLADPATGGIWADAGAVAAGASVRLHVVLLSGEVQWRCISLQGPSTTSPVRATTGTGDGTKPAAPLLPLTSEESTAVVAAFRQAAADTMAGLAADIDALAAASREGDVGRTRARWLSAHLDYERLGAAYGTFGDRDGVIDGLPDGRPDGVHDPEFTGFLRVEYDLWTGATRQALASDVGTLQAAVHELVDGFPGMTISPTDLALRAHEILEVTVSRELSGRSDQGSGTSLATARANVDGTTTVLEALAAPLQRRAPSLLKNARTGLSQLADQLDALRRPDGTWPARTQLTRAQGMALDARIQGLLEQLAPIPDVLQLPPSAAPD